MNEQELEQQQLENFNISVQQAEHSVSLLDAYERLLQNADFQLLIQETYVKNEAIRLVLLKTANGMETEKEQKNIENSMIGISALNQFFNAIVQLGQMSRESLAEFRKEGSELTESEEIEVVN